MQPGDGSGAGQVPPQNIITRKVCSGGVLKMFRRKEGRRKFGSGWGRAPEMDWVRGKGRYCGKMGWTVMRGSLRIFRPTLLRPTTHPLPSVAATWAGTPTLFG